MKPLGCRANHYAKSAAVRKWQNFCTIFFAHFGVNSERLWTESSIFNNKKEPIWRFSEKKRQFDNSRETLYLEGSCRIRGMVTSMSLHFAQKMSQCGTKMCKIMCK